MDPFNWDGALFLSLVAGLVAAVIAWLQFKKEKEGERNRKLLTGSFIAIFVTIISAFVQNCSEKRKQTLATEQDRIKDSSLKASQKKVFQLQLESKDQIIKAVDSSYAKSINASNSALAKYNLVIVDSMHQVVNTLKISSLNPQLSLAAYRKDYFGPVFFEILDGHYILKAQFISSQGTCYNIKLYSYIVKNDFVNYQVLQKDTLIRDTEFMLPENISTFIIFLKNADISKENEVTILFEGTYSKDSKGISIEHYHQHVSFNLKEKKCSPGFLYFNYNDFKKAQKRNRS